MLLNKAKSYFKLIIDISRNYSSLEIEKQVVEIIFQAMILPSSVEKYANSSYYINFKNPIKMGMGLLNCSMK